MELALTPMTFIIGLFFTITHVLLFLKKVIKSTSIFTLEESPIHVIRKRRLLILFKVITLIGLITFFGFGLKVDHPVLYRSVKINGNALLLAYLDVFNTVLLKSMVFLSISMMIPLLYKFPDTRVKSIIFYSVIRLLIYPSFLIYFSRFNYFRFFFTDLIELPESVLLILIFISLLQKIKRHKTSGNLFEQYESIYIYRRCKSSCFLFMTGLLLEVVYYFTLVFLSIGQVHLKYLMDFLMIFRLIYILIILSAITNVIYSKEQPIHDTLVSMYKMRLEMEDESQEERKRIKKNDFYKLTL